MRILFILMLSLHPPRFRRKFAGEMLFAFDQAKSIAEALWFLWDCALSASRQWLFREPLWLYVSALTGGCLPFYIGLQAARPVYLRLRDVHAVSPAAPLFLLCAVASFQAIALTTVFSVFLFRVTIRRAHA